MRLLLARDGVVTLEHAPLAATPQRMAGRMTTQLADTPIDAADEFLYHKTTQRDLYDRHAPNRSACFDTLLWNAEGELTEARLTRAHLAQAKAIWFINSLRGWGGSYPRPIARGVHRANGKMGSRYPSTWKPQINADEGRKTVLFEHFSFHLLGESHTR